MTPDRKQHIPKTTFPHPKLSPTLEVCSPVSLPSLPFTYTLSPPPPNPQRIFASTQTVLSFILQKAYSPSPQAFQKALSWAVGVTEVSGRKRAESSSSTTTKKKANRFFGHWLNNSFYFLVEPSYMRILAYMTLQHQIYTTSVYMSNRGHDSSHNEMQNWAEFKGLGQPLYSVNSHIIASVHSTCFRSLTIDQNWSKSLKFLLPHIENNCSAWHLNKTLIFFKKFTNTMPINLIIIIKNFKSLRMDEALGN